MKYLDLIKTTIAGGVSSFLAYLSPVHNAMYILLIFAAFDLVAGISAGIVVKKEKLKFKKFILSFIYLLIYLSVVFLIYSTGWFQKDLDESLYIVKIITYVFVYFYAANILKNLHELFPENRVIKFLNYILGLEFTKKIPWLKNFLQQEEQQQKNEQEQKAGSEIKPAKEAIRQSSPAETKPGDTDFTATEFND